uniref:Uncharacterized protein n=1 Tax=Aegilops tauschii subsp. strangulata TaxID=200361 RepID=A0A453RD42_AEGTS
TACDVRTNDSSRDGDPGGMDGPLDVDGAPQRRSDGTGSMHAAAMLLSLCLAGRQAKALNEALGPGRGRPARLCAVPVWCSNKCLSGQRGAGSGADRTSDCASAAS